MEKVILDGSPLAEILQGRQAGGSPPREHRAEGRAGGQADQAHQAKAEGPPVRRHPRPTLRHEGRRRCRRGYAPDCPSRCASTSAVAPSPHPLGLLGTAALGRPRRAPGTRAAAAAFADTRAQKAVNRRLGRADNERFLERFRYLVVASQLLAGQDGLRTAGLPSLAAHGGPSPHDFNDAALSPAGAVLTASAAFVLVWLVHWSRRPPVFSTARWLLVLVVCAAAASAVYAYTRRQWLQYLRQHAVEGAAALVANLQAFDASTSSALALIQEVELVSRGYRLSSPLPPISRIEEKGQSRRCQRLRRTLAAAFAGLVPVLVEQCGTLKHLVLQDDLEKYLDVYEISNPDVQEASQGYSEAEFDDAETLKSLRILQYRLSTLRRVYLSSLLALEADGGQPDFARWSTVVDSIQCVARTAGLWSEKFNSILAEEEQFIIPSPIHITPTPGKEKLRNSVRKLSGLSQGIRSLQAKMQVLREETNKSLEDTEDVHELGRHLMLQYESIGADIKSLVQAWEAGKTALALNIDRKERRISQASSGLRSPETSLGGLTAVEEGSPSDALRALNGDLLSPQQSAPSSEQGSNSDDEIFEAIAIPKTRATMSREERLQKIQDDRVRQASARQQRDANTSMLRELESVINLRPHRRAGPGGRVTSL